MLSLKLLQFVQEHPETLHELRHLHSDVIMSVLYGSKCCSLKAREEKMLRVFWKQSAEKYILV